MENNAIYCLHHKFLGFIKRPLCCVDSNGIVFLGNHYKWCDISVITEKNTSFGVLLVVAKGEPRTTILFNDGVSMKIYPNELYFDHGLTNFEFMSGISSAYRELVATIKANGCEDLFVRE